MKAQRKICVSLQKTRLFQDAWLQGLARTESMPGSRVWHALNRELRCHGSRLPWDGRCINGSPFDPQLTGRVHRETKWLVNPLGSSESPKKQASRPGQTKRDGGEDEPPTHY
ncbi:hypothetical protein ROHU_012548 [Labeo rohita]|uniref:Uncharacterized protein n=1 Tax=Labeo rohita TaxID=84645 RepID=A0A498LJT1_LABRO|nr:hypothetical protein ROHU_012548 [Labeo rohita]